jgi:uncharacterized protein (DUF433 family)
MHSRIDNEHPTVVEGDMPASVEAPRTYRFLAERSGSGYRELFVHGTSVRAQTLVSDMENEGLTEDQTAAAYRIPVEAVREALHYVHENEVYLAAERRRDRERAIAKGYLRPSGCGRPSGTIPVTGAPGCV